jgi:internalin A
MPKGKYSLIGLTLGEQQLVHVVSLAGLSELEELRELTLDHNLITDAGLAFLPPLPKLTTINLNNCGLTDSCFEHLAKQPALTRLAIGSNNITGAGLSKYPGAPLINSLSIGSAKLTDEGLGLIAKFTALQSLDLSSSGPLACTNLAPLAAIASLRSFRLARNATDPLVQSLSAATHLEVLDLSESSITDFALDHIGLMTALQDIRFHGCRGLTDSGFLKLLPLGRSVTRVTFGGTRLSDYGFKEMTTKLTELTEVDLSNTGVSPAGLASLVNLRRLSALSVHARHCTDEGLKHLARVTANNTLKNFGISEQSTLSKDRMDAVRASLSRWSF